MKRTYIESRDDEINKKLILIFAGAFVSGIVLIVLTSYIIVTPEETAENFIEDLEAGKINDESGRDQKSELEEFIQFGERNDLENTRMVINSAENIDQAYEVTAQFQAYEYKDEDSEVIESYDGSLVIRMKKVGFREWDIIDVKINPYK
ncbi:hypothetical protein [Pseudalkalibacillus salsuginis]|uniref:hypothetical protein n=1 Tax=Pseudalkalibacillus salsuginis TaxID=2910972 RepID=UPI001F1CFDED|nr:hypothetical protein [Pseudalkalibacillus salsuginis]MCF6411214.1 hypothetical protein [Pseudalkalibacillus salsuginis]